MFYLYKIIKGLVFPPGIFILIFLLNSFIVKNKVLRILNLLSALILYIISISPTTDLMKEFLKVKVNANFQKPDVIFVLGAGLSDESVSRIVKAYELYKIYNVPIVISGYKIEAKMMKSKLLMFSIPDSMLILDSLARNTFENVQNFKKVSKIKNFKNVIVVSSDYHLKRIEKIFKNSNLNLKFVPSNQIDWTAKTILDIVPSYASFSRNIRYLNEIIGYFLIK
ncbi:MAG: YdcF family protein [Candidatus Hydrothermia bacterium]|jgi:uncharacterized SAM-binding protein YcdF (DUF218 family)|nr:YdcF family protein [Candidatus Hydrothermia bacterium]